MKCSKAHKFISPCIDGELAEQDMTALEEHIKACPNCRTEFEEGKELHNLFAQTEEFKAPYGFHTRVMANVSSGKTRVIPGVSVIIRLAETVAVIVVIALGTLSGNLAIKGYAPDKARDIMASLSLDVFNSAPPESLGGVYLALTEASNEK